MDTNIVVYSQCAECEEPGLFYRSWKVRSLPERVRAHRKQ